MKNKCFGFIGSILILLIMSCESGSDSTGKTERDLFATDLARPRFNYTMGRNRITSFPIDFEKDLIPEYELWKKWYVTEQGCLNGMRVRRRGANRDDTVSEGQAYGMLLAYFFNDQQTFDKLMAYAQDHYVTEDGEKRALMHWRVHPEGYNISEFNERVPHGKVWIAKWHLKWDWIGQLYTPDREFVGGEQWKLDSLNTLNYENTLDNSFYFTEQELLAKKWSENEKFSDYYILVSANGRSVGSASDADFDMAAAMCFAAYNWSGPESAIKPGYTVYEYEAARMIRDIMELDITADNFIRNGTDWGGQDCWNPSYFAPAWFRVYAQFTNDYPELFEDFNMDPQQINFRLQQTIGNVYRDLEKIDNNNSKGMVPDWCDTSTNSILSCSDNSSELQQALQDPENIKITEFNNYGTRLYIFELNAPGNIPVNGDQVQMQSYNYYYDAIRTTWRLAVDYSWFGDFCPSVTKNMLMEMAEGFKDVNTIVDGYNWKDGGSWEWQWRDGFNPGLGGGSSSIAFNSMIACSKMVLGPPSDSFYNNLRYGWSQPSNDVEDKNDYGYYPNTLRLLSMLYLSGYFENPLVLTDPAPQPTPSPQIIDFTDLPSNQSIILDGITMYKIKLGYAGYFQINDCEGDYLKISINGGPLMDKPYDWGGHFAMPQYALQEIEVMFISSSTPVKIRLEWW
ncbi:MAG: hypothetical protein JXK07_15775 [Spirochaetes bacterium]|nr:hypothetical protein [Spirochaetota bacterium]MBN2771332.1 hypothetical protein [Spirochaetota bacterium]